MRESAVQRPTLIHTGQSVSNLGSDSWGQQAVLGCHCGDSPAIGGKRTAMRARKKSPHVMVVMLVREGRDLERLQSQL